MLASPNSYLVRTAGLAPVCMSRADHSPKNRNNSLEFLPSACRIDAMIERHDEIRLDLVELQVRRIRAGYRTAAAAARMLRLVTRRELYAFEEGAKVLSSEQYRELAKLYKCSVRELRGA